MDDFLEIGQIVNTVGIKGAIKIVPYTDEITRFSELKKIYIEKNNVLKEFTTEEVRYNKNLVIIKLTQINSIEEAEKYKGCYIKINRKDCKNLEKDAYFIVDMIGLDVFSTEGLNIGKIEDIINTGSNDIYIVKSDSGKQILIPAIKDVVKQIDMQNKKVIINMIEGLV